MTKRLLILAGGISSRMKKESSEQLDEKIISQANNLPKCMIGLGNDNRPFLDYLLYNAAKGGIEEAVLLLNPSDEHTQPYYQNQLANNKTFGLTVLFARQYIPEGFQKPMGTSDAILQTLAQQPHWQQGRFIVCNSDNIYPSHVFEILSQDGCQRMIAFDAVGYDESRVRNCAIVATNETNFLIDLIEKPTDDEWATIKATMPQIGISWNIFGLDPMEVIPFLENTPLHPVRNEKELPVSIRMMVKAKPDSMEVVRLPDVIPDLTSKGDIAEIQAFLSNNFDF